MARAFALSRHAVKKLKRRPARAAILVTAIGLLVSSLVFGLSFVRRVESSIRKTSDRLGADLLVVPTGSRGSAEDVLIDHRVKSFYMDRSLVDRVRRVPGIERVTAQTYLVTVGGACCDEPETMVVAFDQESDFVVRPWLGRKLGYRVDPARSRKMGGTGLGLAIVKHLVKAHGWSMRIESTPGKGTKVKIFLTSWQFFCV